MRSGDDDYAAADQARVQALVGRGCVLERVDLGLELDAPGPCESQHLVQLVEPSPEGQLDPGSEPAGHPDPEPGAAEDS